MLKYVLIGDVLSPIKEVLGRDVLSLPKNSSRSAVVIG